MYELRRADRAGHLRISVRPFVRHFMTFCQDYISLVYASIRLQACFTGFLDPP